MPELFYTLNFLLFVIFLVLGLEQNGNKPEVLLSDNSKLEATP